MHVNAKSGQVNPELPPVISLRLTGHELRPLVLKWRRKNQQVPWSALLESALKTALAPLAGKRHAHLVNGNGGKAA